MISRLYRGDADPHSVRRLKATLHHLQLQANLINGGNGQEIFTTPIVDLIRRHVHPGWKHTHFLSFTEDEVIAHRFGLNCELRDVEDRLAAYDEVLDDGGNWEFAVFAVDLSAVEFQVINPGIYLGEYESNLTIFRQHERTARIVVIDVQSAIEHHKSLPGMHQVRHNAARDKEWLILSLNYIPLNEQRVELSGIMDANFLCDVKKYRKRG